MRQVDRVLLALRRAGEDGLTQADFLGPRVIDGEKPIARLAARIKDLRDAGHEIHTAGERASFAVYVLHEVRPVTPLVARVPVSLF